MNRHRTGGRAVTREVGGMSLSGDEGSGRVRVATYVRISTDEKHQPFSLSAQQSALSAYTASQDGWVQAGPGFRDECSGAGTERPGLRQALAGAAMGTFDVLLVYRVDRLARSLAGLLSVLEELDRCGVGFRSATEPVDTRSAVGRMLIQMLGVFAQFEREVIIDRVIAGMERKAAQGRWTGGTCPYGYALDRTTDRLVPHPDEAPTVRWIFDRYADTYTGTRTIAQLLNDRGVRTREGRLWSGARIGRILANRVYLGEKIFRAVTTSGAHPPLIEQEAFARTGRIRAARNGARNRRTPTNSDYLLTGLITCALCGGRFVGSSAHGRTSMHRYYICSRHARLGRRGCTGPRLRAGPLEQSVLDLLASQYEHSTLTGDAAVLAAAGDADDATARRHERAAVVRRIADTRTRIERYQAAFENGALTPELYQARVYDLTVQLCQLRAHRTDLDRCTDPADSGHGSHQRGRSLRAHLAAAVAAGAYGPVKNWLHTLIVDIRILDRDHIHLCVRGVGLRRQTP